jgi:hypothetical protein
MLRPSGSLLASSRSVRRRTLRQERMRALGHLWRRISAGASVLLGTAVDLLVLLLLPIVYLAAAYLALDLPLRFFAGKAQFTGLGFLAFLAAATISLVGVSRAAQGTPPVAPVRPKFAKAMLVAGWAAALLLTVADLAG